MGVNLGNKTYTVYTISVFVILKRKSFKYAKQRVLQPPSTRTRKYPKP